MLTQKQLHHLYPFFKLYENQLLKLKASSIQTFSNYTQITSQKQLFYPWGQRRIFYQITLTEKQTQAVNQLKSLIIEEEIFPINEYPEQILLRHLHSVGLHTKNAYQRLKKLYIIINVQSGKKGFLQYLQKEKFGNIQSQLKSGVIYTYGKSNNNNFPIIVLQVNKINSSLAEQQNFAIFYTFISLVLHYRMRPHYQQKYIFIIDLGGLSFSQIPYQYMYKFMDWIGVIFGGLSDKILVYNSEKIGILWNICKRWLPDSTVNKVMFVNSNNIKQVHQMIKPNQLQQKYGGKLKNLQEHWPPKPILHQNSRMVFDLSSLNQQNDSVTTQYFSFKSLSMLESVKINPTYKSLGINKQKQISINSSQQEYKIQKQELFEKLTGICGVKTEQNCNCQIF